MGGGGWGGQSTLKAIHLIDVFCTNLNKKIGGGGGGGGGGDFISYSG